MSVFAYIKACDGRSLVSAALTMALKARTLSVMARGGAGGVLPGPVFYPNFLLSRSDSDLKQRRLAGAYFSDDEWRLLRLM